MGWLGDTVPCKCGWVADPTREIDNVVCICSKCGSIYDKKSFGWCLRSKSFEESINEH